jgi:hypothetical protein
MNISFFDDKPTLYELDFKIPFLEKLSKISIDELLNLIIYGLPGSGKTTKIYAFLATILDKRVYDLKNIIFEEDRKIMNYKGSIYHIEIDPIQLGSNEKFFIQTFLKSYIETKNIGLNIPKIILIKNAIFLSKQSQMMLRKMIDKTSITARFIFEISNLSNFLEPLMSRCLLIRVRVPTLENVKLCIYNYLKNKNYDINQKIIDNIINDSNKVHQILNLKKIYGYLRYYLLTKKNFELLYYSKFNEILNYINNKRISFITFQKIREIVNEMYINLVPMEELMDYLFNKLCDMNKDKNDFIFKLIDLTSKCNVNLKKGNKGCLHLEYYIISIIDLIHNQ